MRIYKAKDYADMSRKAANIVSAQVIMKPNCVLGLATGSTPIGLYRQLVEWFRKGDLDFSEVTTVNLDEHTGHIGFNEPGESFDKQVQCVNLTESTIEANKRFFASAEDVPKQAYTMGIKTIMQAKKILIVASGEDKADIVEKAFFGPITPQVPASVLQLHNDVTLVADEAALSRIEGMVL